MTDGTSADTSSDVEETDEAELSRGQFLTKLSLGLGGVMGAMIVLPVAGMALTPAVQGQEFTEAKLGDLDLFKASPGKFVKVVIDPEPGAFDAYVKRRVAFIRYNPPGGTKDSVSSKVVYVNPETKEKTPQGRYSAISNRCAHLGCPVQEGGGNFVCPCHGGAYNTDGERVAGPPARGLDRYMWEVRGEELWAVGMYSVSLSGQKEPLVGPGQHAGDPEALLYPLQPDS